MSDSTSHIATFTRTFNPPPGKTIKSWTMFRNGIKTLEFCPHMRFDAVCKDCNPTKDNLPPISSKDCPLITDCSGSVLVSLLQKSDKTEDPCVFTADEISDRVRELTLSPGIN
jgi:hypothetical protein